jgi:hypothetical protein
MANTTHNCMTDGQNGLEMVPLLPPETKFHQQNGPLSRIIARNTRISVNSLLGNLKYTRLPAGGAGLVP